MSMKSHHFILILYVLFYISTNSQKLSNTHSVHSTFRINKKFEWGIIHEKQIFAKNFSPNLAVYRIQQLVHPTRHGDQCHIPV